MANKHRGEYYVISRTVLTEKQLAALGTVVAESTYVEFLIDSVIEHVSGLTEKERKIFLDKAMIGAKLEILLQLGTAKLRSGKRRKRFKEIIMNLKDCNNDRITAVHGTWEPEITGHEVGIFFPPMGDAAAIHPKSNAKMTAHVLDKLAKRISNGYWDLYVFYSEVWDVPRAQRVLARRLTKR